VVDSTRLIATSQIGCQLIKYDAEADQGHKRKGLEAISHEAMHGLRPVGRRQKAGAEAPEPISSTLQAEVGIGSRNQKKKRAGQTSTSSLPIQLFQC